MEKIKDLKKVINNSIKKLSDLNLMIKNLVPNTVILVSEISRL